MGMRRQSNFASRGPRPLGRIVFALWALLALVLGGTVWSARAVQEVKSELAQTEDHIARLADQLADLTEQSQSAPDASALNAQVERIGYYNTLTGPRFMALTEVLALLEETLPAEVWISQLTYSLETGQLSLSLQTDVETALPAALRALEETPALASVILDRQLRLTQGGRQLLQYDVKAAAS